MIDAQRIQSINQSIRGFAEEGLSQKEARVKMDLQYGISDSFQLRVWIAVGYYMYNKEKGERLNE